MCRTERRCPPKWEKWCGVLLTPPQKQARARITLIDTSHGAFLGPACFQWPRNKKSDKQSKFNCSQCVGPSVTALPTEKNGVESLKSRSPFGAGSCFRPFSPSVTDLSVKNNPKRHYVSISTHRCYRSLLSAALVKLPNTVNHRLWNWAHGFRPNF
jgi:hypothetical protein